LKLAPCAQQQTITTIIKGTNEGVHQEEAMVGRIELHHHHCCALKNYASSPNLKGLAHLEVWVFWTKLEMMRFGGSNSNVSFYSSILFYFSKPRGYVCFTYMKIVIW